MFRYFLRVLPPLAWRAWFTPPPVRTSNESRLSRTQVAGRDAFTAGHGPLALVLHGWGGTPTQMEPIADALAAEGYRAIVPDLPGRAGTGRSDIKQMAAAVDEVIAEVGEPAVLVAHSFAALALRIVFAHHAPPLVVMVAPLLDVDDALDRFGDLAGLFPWTRSALRRRLRDWDPELFTTVSGIHVDQLPAARVLILHDPDDPRTSFENAAMLAARRPDTEIVALDGTGHNRILAADAAIDEMRTFIQRSRTSAA